MGSTPPCYASIFWEARRPEAVEVDPQQEVPEFWGTFIFAVVAPPPPTLSSLNSIYFLVDVLCRPWAKSKTAGKTPRSGSQENLRKPKKPIRKDRKTNQIRVPHPRTKRNRATVTVAPLHQRAKEARRWPVSLTLRVPPLILLLLLQTPRPRRGNAPAPESLSNRNNLRLQTKNRRCRVNQKQKRLKRMKPPSRAQKIAPTV
jgi:hypothetical protein